MRKGFCKRWGRAALAAALVITGVGLPRGAERNAGLNAGTGQLPFRRRRGPNDVLQQHEARASYRPASGQGSQTFGVLYGKPHYKGESLLLGSFDDEECTDPKSDVEAKYRNLAKWSNRSQVQMLTPAWLITMMSGHWHASEFPRR